jgi:hypothetical protein
MDSAFYFEVTPEDLSGRDIGIGFASGDSFVANSGDRFFFFGVDLKRKSVVSPSLLSDSVEAFDSWDKSRTLGCGFVNGKLFFVLDGSALDIVIDFDNVSRLIPVIVTNCVATLKYNFGQEPFVADVIAIPHFGILSQVTLPTTVPIAHVQAAALDEYDALIERGLPLYSVPKRFCGYLREYPQRTAKPRDGNRTIGLRVVHNAADSLPGQRFWLGQSCIVARARLANGQLLGDGLKQRINRICRVVDLEEGAVVKVKFEEPWSISKEFVVSVDSGFLDGLSPTFEAMLGPQRDFVGYAKSYSIRMVRFLLLVLLDYYRTLPAKAQTTLDVFLSKVGPIFPLVIRECFDTVITAKSKPSWATSRASDFVLANEVSGDLLRISYKVPGDRHAWRRFVRALVVHHPKEMGQIFETVLSVALQDLSVSESVLMKLVPPRYRFISVAAAVDLSYSCDLGEGSLGFIPVLGSNHSQEITLLVCDSPIKDPHRDVSFTPSCRVSIKAESQRQHPLEFGILPISKTLSETQVLSPLGDIHLIFLVLSFVISTKKLPELEQFLKRRILPVITKSTNFFATTFMVDLLSPILHQCQWVPDDMTPELFRSFEEIRTAASAIAKDWAPLSCRSERYLLLAFSTWSHSLDVAATSSGDVGKLYDTYEEAENLTKSSPFSRFLGFLSLSCVLGVDVPIYSHFPRWLFGYHWSLYSPSHREDFIAKYDEFLQDVEEVSGKWSVDLDSCLVQLLESHPGIEKKHPIDLRVEPFDRHTILGGFTPRAVWTRMNLIASLWAINSSVQQLIDFKAKDTNCSIICQLYESCRGCLSVKAKTALATKYVIEDVSRSSSKFELRLNRGKAREFFRDRNSSLGKPLFWQLVEEFEKNPTRVDLINKAGSDPPWKVNLEGEGASDMGGPGRETFTEVILEIGNPALGLFIPSPNMRNGIGRQQDLLIPNPDCDSRRERHFYYAGVLFSMCFIAKLLVPLQIVPFVWNALSGRSVTRQDIVDMDVEFGRVIQTVLSGDPESESEQRFATLASMNYEVRDSTGKMVPLIAGGSSVPLTMDRRLEFVERAMQFRVKEFKAPLDALRNGFFRFFNEPVARIMMPADLESFVCGRRGCAVDQLKKLCEFSDSRESEWLWRFLGEVGDEERLAFVKFATGRMGLPPPGMKWQEPLKIVWESSDVPDPRKKLPKGVTCFSKIYIQKYQSEEWFRRHMMAALKYGFGTIEDGNNVNFGVVIAT